MRVVCLAGRVLCDDLPGRSAGASLLVRGESLRANRLWFLIVLVLLLPIVCLVGCSKDSGTPEPDIGGYYAEIGPEGGVLEVLDANSPLHGLKISVPDSALEEQITIRVTECDYTLLPPLGEESEIVSPAVLVQPEGAEFLRQVDIALPYSLKPGMCHGDLMMFAFDADGNASHLLTQDVDSAGCSLTASTFHFSGLAVYNVDWLLMLTTPVASTFDIDRDALTIRNEYAPGYCMGMSCLTLWYFHWMKGRYGDLRNPLQVETREIELAADAQSAMEAFRPLGLAHQDGGYLSPDEVYAHIWTSLFPMPPLLEPRPAMLVLSRPPGGADNTHFVIATEIIIETGRNVIKLYDPNYNLALQDMIYDPLSHQLAYSGWHVVSLFDKSFGFPRGARVALNTALHAGTWDLQLTLGNTAGFPCEVELAPLEKITIEPQFDDKPDMVSVTHSTDCGTVGLTGRINESSLTLSGRTCWEYRVEGSPVEWGPGNLEGFEITFGNHVSIETGSGTNNSSGVLTRIPEAWYSYDVTGNRPASVGLEAWQARAFSDQITNTSGLFWSVTEQDSVDSLALIVETDYPGVIDYYEPVALTVRTGFLMSDLTVEYAGGIYVVLVALGGIPEPMEGTTDAEGYFRSTITLYPPFDCTEITIFAYHSEEYYAMESVAACRLVPDETWALMWGDELRYFNYENRFPSTGGVLTPQDTLCLVFDSMSEGPTAIFWVGNVSTLDIGQPVECNMVISLGGPDNAVSPSRYSASCPVMRTYVTFSRLDLPTPGGLPTKVSGELTGHLVASYMDGQPGDSYWKKVGIIQANFQDIVVGLPDQRMSPERFSSKDDRLSSRRHDSPR
jgi:hypothetical protein